MTEVSQQVLIARLRQHGVEVECFSELKNGLRLIQIANRCLFDGLNAELLEKLQASKGGLSGSQASRRAGNNVININFLLKFLGNNKTLNVPRGIKDLTFYQLLEGEPSEDGRSKMQVFVEWMVFEREKYLSGGEESPVCKNQAKKRKFESSSLTENESTLLFQTHSKKASDKKQESQNEDFKEQTHVEMNHNQINSTKAARDEQSEAQQSKEEEDFQNLYFASSIKDRVDDREVQKLSKRSYTGESEQEGEKVVRRGSFKLLKPKVNFIEENVLNASPKELSEPKKVDFELQEHPNGNLQSQKSDTSNHEPQELRDISIIQNNNLNISNNLMGFEESISREQQNGELNLPEAVGNKRIGNPTATDQENHISLIAGRKTVAKGMPRPPMYRPSAKKTKSSFQGQSSIQKSSQTARKLEERSYSHQKRKYHQSSLIDLDSQIEQQMQFIQQFEDQDEKNLSRVNFSSEYMEEKSINSQTKRNSHEREQNFNSDAFNSKRIQEQEVTNNSKTIPLRSTGKSKSQRKVFNVELRQLTYSQKMQIAQWLLKHRVVGDMSERTIHKNVLIQETVHRIPQLFSNGVLFVRLCNVFIGRGKEISCFKNPTKRAEIHSNFSRLFEYLQHVAGFESNSEKDQGSLLFRYELFVPNSSFGGALHCSDETAIWNLLLQIYESLEKRQTKHQSLKKLSCSKQQETGGRIQSQIQHRIDGPRNNDKHHESQVLSSQTVRVTEQRGLYQTSTPENSKNPKRTKSRPRQRHSSFKTEIEFANEDPKCQFNSEPLNSSDLYRQLIQNEEPTEEKHENQSHLEEGYKLRHIKKTFDSQRQYVETPKKRQHRRDQVCFGKSSLLMNSRSKGKAASNQHSLRKSIERHKSKMGLSSQKPEDGMIGKVPLKQPKITLKMQMKVQRFLKNTPQCQQHLSKFSSKLPHLLEDPIRNGTLINIILRQYFKTHSHSEERLPKFYDNPRSIQDCRNNYKIVFRNFMDYLNSRSKVLQRQQFSEKDQKSDLFLYAPFIENILKGQKCYFYGIVYEIISSESQIEIPKQQSIEQLLFSEENCPTHQNIVRTQKLSQEQIKEQFYREPLSWIRSIEMHRIDSTKASSVSRLKIRSIERLREKISTAQLLYAIAEDFFLVNRQAHSILRPVYEKAETTLQKQSNLKKILSWFVHSQILTAEQNEDCSILRQTKRVSKGEIKYLDKLLHCLIDITVLRLKLTSAATFGRNDQKGSVTAIIPVPEVHTKAHRNERLETTAAECTECQPKAQSHQQETKVKSDSLHIEIPWVRKLPEFSICSLAINNGIVICRLLSKLSRKNISSLNESPNLSKAQSLSNIRKALKLMPVGHSWSELDIYEADAAVSFEVYQFIREKFKNCYDLRKNSEPS